MSIADYQKQRKVILLRHTPSPEETIALGAKLCYSKSEIEDLRGKVEAKDQSAFIEKLMNMGHESVLEHVTFTFGIEGVSRVLLAQITRHRIGASFSVQSQRYVSYKDGFGGKVFKDKVFSVPAGSPLLLPNMVGEIPDDFDMEDVGWSGPRADFVFENLEYEMTWRKKTCRIVYHDGVGGDIFSDVIHTVPFGSHTPPPPHLDP